MNTRETLCLFVLALSSSPLSATAQTVTTSASAALTDDVIYMHFFRHVARYQEFASAAESSGVSSPFRHSFRRNLALDPNQEHDLNQIAADYLNQSRAIQQEIAVVIKAFRVAYPPGKLKSGSLPPPPPGLAPLVAQKKAIVLAARDRLRTALGDDEFSRVDALIKTRVSPQISRTVVSR